VRAFLFFSFVCGLIAESVAGLHWTAPAGWKSEAPRPMRAATYTVADAECVVYFFGQGQGGGVQANIDRWKGQFSQPNGQPVAAKTGKRTVHGLPVTTIELAGTYAGMAGPMGGAAAPKPDYRMLGAIVENPGGNLFVKFTGPVKTIAANQTKFDQLLGSFDKDK
jgi:hypothetical protein